MADNTNTFIHKINPLELTLSLTLKKHLNKKQYTVLINQNHSAKDHDCLKT